MSQQPKKKKVGITATEVKKLYDMCEEYKTKSRSLLESHYKEDFVLSEMSYEWVSEMASTSLFLQKTLEKTFPSLEEDTKGAEKRVYSLPPEYIQKLAKSTLILADIKSDLIKCNISMDYQ